MSVNKLKVVHHVKKLVPSLNITQSDEESVKLLVDALLNSYREYQSYPINDFQSIVKDVLKTVLKQAEESKTVVSNNNNNNNNVSGSVTPTRVLSLNSQLTNAQRSIPSKRSRPIDENESKKPIQLPETDVKEDKRFKISKEKNQSTYLKEIPKTKFRDMAGIHPIINQIKELVCYPLKHPRLYSHLGVSPPCGILLHGPSGCGKTTLASAIAGETGLPFFKVSGPELIGGTSGESEERIRQVFEAAASNTPSILFIDAIDVIAAKKDSSQRGMDRRIIAQLFDSIDFISNLSKDDSQDEILDAESLSTNKASVFPKLVILLAATNKPESIDPGVRGRFSREIALPVPDAEARTKIIQLHCEKMTLSSDLDFKTLGKITPGFVGADLLALVREAGLNAICRVVKSIEQEYESDKMTDESREIDSLDFDFTPSIGDGELNHSVEMGDFLKAAKTILPTAKREGFAIAPDVTWNDIGALSEVREELKHNILEPIAHPDRFRALGLEVPAGVLFFGPPGCGKTLLAKAIANQSGANFISVKGPELLNMYVGESESRVRQVFARARASSPCVIFFDELDALCPKRSSGWEGSSSSGNGVSERVVNQLLTELDGLESRKDVYIIAATNRLELIDDAMLRPGRLGNLLYVPLPSSKDRVSILEALTRKVAVEYFSEDHPEGVDLKKIAFDPRAEGFSGADCSALVREAGLAVIKEISVNDILDHPFTSTTDDSNISTVIKARHFEAAFNKVRPSVNHSDRIKYEEVKLHLKEGMSAIEALQAAFNPKISIDEN